MRMWIVETGQELKKFLGHRCSGVSQLLRWCCRLRLLSLRGSFGCKSVKVTDLPTTSNFSSSAGRGVDDRSMFKYRVPHSRLS